MIPGKELARERSRIFAIQQRESNAKIGYTRSLRTTWHKGKRKKGASVKELKG